MQITPFAGLRPLCAAALASLGLASVTSAGGVYYVGNSLTWDSIPAGISEMAAQSGNGHAFDYHIRCSQSLDYIWNNPADVCVTPNGAGGTWDQALGSGEWDAISLQPYYDVLEGSAGAINRVQQFYDAAQTGGRNAETPFYVYAAWPSGSDAAGFDYSEVWQREYDSSYGTRMGRDFFTSLVDGVRALPGVDADRVLMIPIGEAMFEVDQRAKAGLIPGLADAEGLYRDPYHVNTLGRYVAAATVVATLYGVDPSTLTVSGYYGASPAMTPAAKAALDDAVWDVVIANASYTGVPEPVIAAPLLIGCLALRRRR